MDVLYFTVQEPLWIGGEQMDLNKKVYFTLSIGFPEASYEDVFTLEELGFNPDKEDIETFLEREWIEWKNNYIEGYWSFEKEN